jgi:hypothetical protein
MHLAFFRSETMFSSAVALNCPTYHVGLPNLNETLPDKPGKVA